jgi:hypothetical protein
MFVISFLVQCNPPLVGAQPPFADFHMPHSGIRFRIKIEVR